MRNALKTIIEIVVKSFTHPVGYAYWAFFCFGTIELQKKVFELGGGPGVFGEGIIMAFCLFIYWFISFTMLIISYFIKADITSTAKKDVIWGIASLLLLCLMFVIYKALLSGSGHPVEIIAPLIFVPLLSSFIATLRKYKLFKFFLIILLLIPTVFIAVDKAYEARFINYCKSDMPDVKFDTINLPNNYYANTNKKLELRYRRIEAIKDPYNNSTKPHHTEGMKTVVGGLRCDGLDEDAIKRLESTLYDFYCHSEYFKENKQGIKKSIYYTKKVGTDDKYYTLECSSERSYILVPTLKLLLPRLIGYGYKHPQSVFVQTKDK